jgi:hypothetical protein
MTVGFPLKHKMSSSVISPQVESDEDVPVVMDVTLKHLTAKVLSSKRYHLLDIEFSFRFLCQHLTCHTCQTL